MKDLMLTNDGELIIQNGRIPLVSGNDLMAQKVRQVLRTYLGEWKYDPKEGIDVYAIITKNPNFDIIEDNIKAGLLQVDETFRLTKFDHTEDKNRHTIFSFSAINKDSEEITVEL